MSTDTRNRLSGWNHYPPGGHLGPWYWDGTAVNLTAGGHRVFTPALGDEYQSNLTDHIAQVCRLITENNLREIILAGYSYGGFVITGIAARVSGRIRHLVYIDSGLPDVGESLMDLLQKVYAGHSTVNLPDPNPSYREKIRYDPKNSAVLQRPIFAARRASSPG